MEEDIYKEFPVIVAANKEELAEQLAQMEPQPERYIVQIPDGTTEVADESSQLDEATRECVGPYEVRLTAL